MGVSVGVSGVLRRRFLWAFLVGVSCARVRIMGGGMLGNAVAVGAAGDGAVGWPRALQGRPSLRRV